MPIRYPKIVPARVPKDGCSSWISGSLATFRRGTLLVGLAVLGCVPAGDGLPPPPARVYFPVALAVDAGNEWLYVVNSDFDLQFNQGTVQSLSVAKVLAVARQPCSSDQDCAPIEEFCDDAPTEENGGNASFFCVAAEGEDAGKPCGELRERSAADRALSPGRCAAVEPGERDLIEDVVGISAFATAGELVRQTSAGGQIERERLFLPVRGDSSLHWIDVEQGRLRCGQEGEGLGRCSPEHRITAAPGILEDEELEIAPEPFDLTATSDGRVIVLSHQAEGRASVVVNDWETKPRLVATMSGLPNNPMNVAALPRPALVDVFEPGTVEYQAGFLMTARSDPAVHLLRFFDDGLLDALEDEDATAAEFARPALVDVAASRITANSSGVDSRGIAIDDTKRRNAEAACDDDPLCLELAARVPLDVYVANRAPNSLLVGTTDSADTRVVAEELPTFHDNVPLTAGPSRVVLGQVRTAAGVYERRVFVICFDSALIYVYDPLRGLVETAIDTGRGPHSIAFHGQKPLAFIGHFTDSYIGVISLDQAHPQTYGSTLALIGTPTPPRASK